MDLAPSFLTKLRDRIEVFPRCVRSLEVPSRDALSIGLATMVLTLVAGVASMCRWTCRVEGELAVMSSEDAE
jgi:hypothetical protein